MIIPIEKSERLYKYAETGWIADSTGVRVRYEFISKIDAEGIVTCFLYVRFQYGIFKRLFGRGQMERSRFVARVKGQASEFFYNFNTVRAVVCEAYGSQIPFRFYWTEELKTIQFSGNFRGKIKLYLFKAWRAVTSV